MQNILFVATNDRLLTPLMSFLNGNFNRLACFHEMILTTRGSSTPEVSITDMDVIFFDTYEGEDEYANMRNLCAAWRFRGELRHDVRIFQIPLSIEGLEREPSMFRYNMPDWTWRSYRLDMTQTDPDPQADIIATLLKEQRGSAMTAS